MACEKCWRDAAERVLHMGGSQADRYLELLEERKNNPCSPAEQGQGPTAWDFADSNVAFVKYPKQDGTDGPA